MPSLEDDIAMGEVNPSGNSTAEYLELAKKYWWVLAIAAVGVWYFYNKKA